MRSFAKVLFGVGGLAAIILLIMLIHDMSYNPKGTSDWHTLGQFGESMTAVAVIWALAAGIIAYNTLVSQKEEISETSKRFEAEQKLSQMLNSQNAFQNGFFTLLERQREIVNSYQNDKYPQQEGTRRFMLTWQSFLNYYQHYEIENRLDPENALALARESMDKEHPSIRHYYRSLYQHVKYVDDYATSVAGSNFDSKTFIDLIQGQISEWEFKLILINSLNPRYESAMKLYVKYHLLENMDFDHSNPKQIELKSIAESRGFRFKQS